MLSSRFIVVEGKLSRFLLESVLPEDVVFESKFIVGSSYTNTLSKARTLLVSSDLPVFLIVNADTTDRAAIEEKEEFIQQFLGQLSSPEHFDIFIAIPEIASMFFQDRNALEQLAGQPNSDIQWEIAQYQPKEILKKILKTEDLQEALRNRLTPPIIQKLRETELIQQILGSSREVLYKEAV